MGLHLHLQVHVEATNMWVLHTSHTLVHVLLPPHRGTPAPPQQRGLLLAKIAPVAVQQLQRLAERRMGLHLKVHLNPTKVWVVHTSNMDGRATVVAKVAMRGGPRGQGVVVHLQ
jgi:hypothetical protein